MLLLYPKLSRRVRSPCWKRGTATEKSFFFLGVDLQCKFDCIISYWHNQPLGITPLNVTPLDVHQLTPGYFTFIVIFFAFNNVWHFTHILSLITFNSACLRFLWKKKKQKNNNNNNCCWLSSLLAILFVSWTYIIRMFFVRLSEEKENKKIVFPTKTI